MMRKWFEDVTDIGSLRKQYRELLKRHHPDNPGGSVKATQEINAEYDRIFASLSKGNGECGTSAAYGGEAENEAFKGVINSIIHINADVEVIGSWVWVHGGYEYRRLLKEIGFKFAPKKKCWCWHYGGYRRHHEREVPLDEIRMKYGSQTVKSKSKQYTLN